MGQEIIVIRPLSTELSTYSTSLPSCCYGQAVFLPQHLFSQLLPLPSLLCLHHPSRILLRIFHFLVSLLILSQIPLLFPFLVPLLILIFCLLLLSHTSMDRSVSSSSCTLTSPLPSSLPPSYSIYRPIPIYTSSRPSNFSMVSIPYLYSSVLSTSTLSLSYHGSSSTRVSSTPSGPAPSGLKKRATSSWTRDRLRSWPRDNTYYATRRQCPRPTIPGSSFPLLSSWANPSSYRDNPMNLTCNPRTNLQAPGGSSSNPLFRSDFSHPHIYSPMVTFNEPSENVRGMFSFVLSCEFSPGANNKILLSSLIKR